MKQHFRFAMPEGMHRWRNLSPDRAPAAAGLTPAIQVPAPLAIQVVAVVYALGTKVALQALNLPGDVSPVFPDVGIALAAVLIVGRMALLGSGSARLC